MSSTDNDKHVTSHSAIVWGVAQIFIGVAHVAMVFILPAAPGYEDLFDEPAHFRGKLLFGWAVFISIPAAALGFLVVVSAALQSKPLMLPAVVLNISFALLLLSVFIMWAIATVTYKEFAFGFMTALINVVVMFVAANRLSQWLYLPEHFAEEKQAQDQQDQDRPMEFREEVSED